MPIGAASGEGPLGCCIRMSGILVGEEEATRQDMKLERNSRVGVTLENSSFTLQEQHQRIRGQCSHEPSSVEFH